MEPSKKPEEERSLAVRIAASATDDEKVALINWLEALLELKESNLSTIEKGKSALSVTAQSKVILPLLKIIARDAGLAKQGSEKLQFSSIGDVVKYLQGVWRDRSLPVKMGIGVGVVTSIIFGSQGAGIAALGSAIGVPLWIVLGAGATFATVLYEEIKGKKR